VRRFSIALLLSLAIAGCGSRFDSGTLPERLSHEAFWGLVSGLSEPPGVFAHSDNLVSNETLVAHTIRQHGSNVETYLNNQQRMTFCRSLAALPLGPGSAFILSKGTMPLRQKLASCPRGVNVQPEA
jgi:hypothetical protein